MQVTLCNICRKEVKDDEQAGLFQVAPPIPEEIRRFKDNPAAAFALSPAEAQKLTMMAMQHQGSIERQHICGTCTSHLTAHIKEISAGMQHTGAVN